MLKDYVIFSTAVEPPEPTGSFISDLLTLKKGDGIIENNAVIYSVYRNNINSCNQLLSIPKDNWPPRLGQFGTFTFPGGLNNSNVLYAYGIAIKGYDNCFIKLLIK